MFRGTAHRSNTVRSQHYLLK